MIETAGRNIDFLGPPVRLVRQRCAASVTESSNCAGVGFVSVRFPAFPFELRAFDDDPRNRLRARGAPTVFAVTVCANSGISTYRESNLSAVAPASDHSGFLSEILAESSQTLRGPRSKDDNLSAKLTRYGKASDED
jgi:hypothetical protein